MIGEGLFPLVREHSANKREHDLGVELAMTGVRRLCRKPMSMEFVIRLALSTATTR